jgi:hypothetical protein
MRTCTVAGVRVNPIASCGQWQAVLEDVVSIRPRTDAALIAASAGDPAQDDAAPWLYGIATNLVRHWLRGSARGRSTVARVLLPFEGDHADAALDRIEARLLGPLTTKPPRPRR